MATKPFTNRAVWGAKPTRLEELGAKLHPVTMIVGEEAITMTPEEVAALVSIFSGAKCTAARRRLRAFATKETK